MVQIINSVKVFKNTPSFYMRYIIITITLLAITFKSMGQDVLPTDDKGKVNFEEIVKMNTYTRQQLLANARDWVNETFDYEKKSIRYDSNTVSVTGRFLVYIKGAFSPQIHGSIRYKLFIFVKDDKYMYQFTSFVFEYYSMTAMNRYKYIPAPTGKEKPLEDPHFPGFEAPWEKHKQRTYDVITKEIESLKGAMYTKSASEVTPPEQKPSLKEEWDK